MQMNKSEEFCMLSIIIFYFILFPLHMFSDTFYLPFRRNFSRYLTFFVFFASSRKCKYRKKQRDKIYRSYITHKTIFYLSQFALIIICYYSCFHTILCRRISLHTHKYYIKSNKRYILFSSRGGILFI